MSEFDKLVNAIMSKYKLKISHAVQLFMEHMGTPVLKKAYAHLEDVRRCRNTCEDNLGVMKAIAFNIKPMGSYDLIDMLNVMIKNQYLVTSRDCKRWADQVADINAHSQV